jgi:hypothetical protein
MKFRIILTILFLLAMAGTYYLYIHRSPCPDEPASSSSSGGYKDFAFPSK